MEELYNKYYSQTSLDVRPTTFYQQCYDATWAMGKALNYTYNGVCVLLMDWSMVHPLIIMIFLISRYYGGCCSGS